MKLVNDTLIKKWEALRLVAYLPTPHDKWTIGWGHTATTKQGMEINNEQAQILFNSDIAWAEDAVNRLVKVGLTQHQFDALVSFVFNIGEANFKRSTTLKKLNAGDYEGAAHAMTYWNKQRQNGELVTLRGLVRRRAEEVEYFLTPDTEEVAQNFPPEIPTNGIVKPLSQSKELIGGIGSIITGIGTLDTQAQNMFSTIASAALIGYGIYFIVNRLVARRKGQR